MWAVEDIPNADFLFLRVHRNSLTDEPIPLGVFRDHGDGMSTDWDKYSTPQQTQARAKRSLATDNGVLKLNVGRVREIEGLSVKHTPLLDNQAHTDVFGDKKAPRVRLKLQRLAEWVITIEV